MTFRYQFAFPNGEQKTFAIELDPMTLQVRLPARSTYPEWTRLGHSKCPNCPLAEASHPRCPAAVSLIEVVDYFSRSLSIEQAEVRVETAERQYVKHCPLPEAVSAMIGIYMATSGCPIMAKLKPMVRFHLPFATTDDTRYRALSMYLLAQYFIARRGGEQPDWAFARLVQLYEEIVTVNAHFFKRLAGLGIEDTSLNAIVRLDAFANTIAFTVNQQLLDELEQLFQAYLEPPST